MSTLSTLLQEGVLFKYDSSFSSNLFDLIKEGVALFQHETRKFTIKLRVKGTGPYSSYSELILNSIIKVRFLATLFLSPISVSRFWHIRKFTRWEKNRIFGPSKETEMSLYWCRFDELHNASGPAVLELNGSGKLSVAFYLYNKSIPFNQWKEIRTSFCSNFPARNVPENIRFLFDNNGCNEAVESLIKSTQDQPWSLYV